MFNWNVIPEFKVANTVDENLNIDSHFDNLLKIRQSEVELKYKEEFAKIELEKYQKQLKSWRKMYDCFFNKLFDPFQKALEAGNKTCTIGIEMYGPNTHYYGMEKEYLDQALDDFCLGLCTKGYIYHTYDETKQITDFMEGTCTVGTKYVEITLK